MKRILSFFAAISIKHIKLGIKVTKFIAVSQNNKTGRLNQACLV
jgi:hypothetical protein